MRRSERIWSWATALNFERRIGAPWNQPSGSTNAMCISTSSAPGLQGEPADLGVAHATFVGLGGFIGLRVVCPCRGSGFPSVGKGRGRGECGVGVGGDDYRIGGLGGDDPVGHVKFDAVEEPGVHVGKPLVLAGCGPGGLDGGGAEIVFLQEPGLEEHIGDVDCLLVGARRFLGEVDLFEVGVNDEPDVGNPDRGTLGLHVVDLDDEGREDRVAQQVIKGGVGAGELVRDGALGLCESWPSDRRGLGRMTFCPPDSRPFSRTSLNTVF